MHIFRNLAQSLAQVLANTQTPITMNTTRSDDLISLPHAATRLDISVRGLYRLIASNELPPPVKIGGSSKLFESDLNTYLNRLKERRDTRYNLPTS